MDQSEPISFVQSQFLLYFFFKSFPKFAYTLTVLKVNVLSEVVNKDGIHVLRKDGSRIFEKGKTCQSLISHWSRVISTLSLNTLVDDLRGFVAHPYVCLLMGVATPLIFHAFPQLVSFPLPEDTSAHLVNIFVMVFPSSLLVWHNEGFGSAVYRPDKADCQFEFDQCVPKPTPHLLSFLESYGHFTRGLLHTLLPTFGSLLLLGLSWMRGSTPSFKRCW